MFKRKNPNVQVNKENLLHLFEIEADITYAKHNSKIGKANYQAYLIEIGHKRYHGEKNPHETFETHPSFFDRYHWIKKIVELHQKEESKKIKTQPLFASKREYNE